jgi:hypothetical protein
MAEIFKFPSDASRRVHSRKPRRSKNGTPEERAARAASTAAKMVPAAIVDLSEMMAEAPADRAVRRKLRGSPLREKVGPISFAVTIVGKMYTAGLPEEALDLEESEREGWLQTLQLGSAAARFVADELGKAAERLQTQIKEPDVMTTQEFKEAYDQASPEIQHLRQNPRIQDTAQVGNFRFPGKFTGLGLRTVCPKFGD